MMTRNVRFKLAMPLPPLDNIQAVMIVLTLEDKRADCQYSSVYRVSQLYPIIGIAHSYEQLSYRFSFFSSYHDHIISKHGSLQQVCVFS